MCINSASYEHKKQVGQYWCKISIHCNNDCLLKYQSIKNNMKGHYQFPYISLFALNLPVYIKKTLHFSHYLIELNFVLYFQCKKNHMLCLSKIESSTLNNFMRSKRFSGSTFIRNVQAEYLKAETV